MVIWLLLIPVAIYIIGFVSTWRYQMRYWSLHLLYVDQRRVALYVAIRWPWVMYRWHSRGWSYRSWILDQVIGEPSESKLEEKNNGNGS